MTLSIASPGVKKYMHAYTRQHAPNIFNAVDFLNVSILIFIPERLSNCLLTMVSTGRS